MKAYSFDKESLKKVGKGALIAMGGALLVYLSENLTEFDFGAYTPLVFAIASILINSAKSFIEGD